MSQTIDAIEDEVVLLDESGSAHRPRPEERRARTRHRAPPRLLVPRPQCARRGARHPPGAHQAGLARRLDELLLRASEAGGVARLGRAPPRRVRARHRAGGGGARAPAVPVPRDRRERHGRERGVPGLHRDAPPTSPTPTRARSPSSPGSPPRSSGAPSRRPRGRSAHGSCCRRASWSCSVTDVLDSAIDDELRAFFADARVRAGEFGAHYAALWESLEQQSSGGKRIRPRLVQRRVRGSRRHRPGARHGRWRSRSSCCTPPSSSTTT